MKEGKKKKERKREEEREPHDLILE